MAKGTWSMSSPLKLGLMLVVWWMEFSVNFDFFSIEFSINYGDSVLILSVSTAESEPSTVYSSSSNSSSKKFWSDYILLLSKKLVIVSYSIEILDLFGIRWKHQFIFQRSLFSSLRNSLEIYFTLKILLLDSYLDWIPRTKFNTDLIIN